MRRRELLALPLAARAARAADTLDARIRAKVRGFAGEVFLYASNLDTGAAYGLRPDEQVRTASTIKLPIMAAVFDLASQGKLRWDEELPLREQDRVSGSGILREFTAGTPLRLRDVVRLMIVVSDNTATNLILDRITADAVNAYLDRIGLRRTRSLRKVRGDGNDLKTASGHSKAGLDPENQKFGLGVSTPREMVTLLERLERGELVSREASREMIEILKRQQYKDGIGRRLPGRMVASKSGALDALRSDVGIVYHDGGRIALAVTVDGMPKVNYGPENAGNVLIADLTGALLDGLTR